MSDERNLPVSRSLAVRPQLLGVLPTLSFWNDSEQQRLMNPLFVVTGLPLTPLFFLLLWLQVPIWCLFVGCMLYPYLIMGLVERHVRKELRRRSLTGELNVARASTLPIVSRKRTLPAMLAALCFVAAMLALFDVSGVVMGIVLAVGVGGSLAVALLPRTQRIANQLKHSAAAQLPRTDDQ